MSPSTTEVDVSSLRDRFSGAILTPAESDYDDARSIFNAMIDKRPAVIFQCENEDDIRAALTVARERDLEIAVRSGGHSVAGSGVTEGGIVIDLRRMNQVEVDPQTRTASIAGGATWADVDRACTEHGLATTGGRVSTTGVVGLTTGGGSGWLERLCGLACDNIVSAELITADGESVYTDANENPDLFWALHGGGGNFGIVTRLTLQLHELEASTLALLIFEPSKSREVARHYRDLIEGGADERLGGGLGFLTGPPEPFVPEALQGKLVFAVIGVYAGGEAEAREVLAPILELEPDGPMVAEMPYAELQQAIDDPPGYRNYWSAEHLDELTDEGIDAFCAQGGRMISPAPAQHLLIPWGGAVSRNTGDEPLPHRGSKWVLHPFGLWDEEADDARVIEWVRTCRSEFKPWSNGTVYLNFTGDEGEDRIVAGLGAANYERLARVKAEYDPDNRFHLNHNIKPSSA